MSLSAQDIRRYSRQLLLTELTGAKQERLGQARVCLTGDREVGAVCAGYLRAAGVGTVEIETPRAISKADVTAEAPRAESAPERWIRGSLLAVNVLAELLGLPPPQSVRLESFG